MAVEETEESIDLAITEMNALKNRIGSIGTSNELMFTRFNNAFKLLTSKGKIEGKPTDDGFYSSSKHILANYFLVENDELYTPLSNCTTFFLEHYGNSQQFALALSMIFFGDVNINCFPVKVKILIKNETETTENYHYINFVKFRDNDETLIMAGYADLYFGIGRVNTFEEIADALKEIYSNNDQKCIDVQMEGMAYFEQDIDLKKNFTILQTLTNNAVIDFNYEGYQLDFLSAELEKCSDLKNYLNSKDLSYCLKTYLWWGRKKDIETSLYLFILPMQQLLVFSKWLCKQGQQAKWLRIQK